MRRRDRRLIMIAVGGVTLLVAAGLVLMGLSSRITYFYGPTDLAALDHPPAAEIRLGGLVEEGSIARGEGLLVRFNVTDGAATIPVSFEGALPDLFGERQGVIVQGVMQAGGTFEARHVLAKHDETYMPREVVEALRASGEWRGPEPLADPVEDQ